MNTAARLLKDPIDCDWLRSTHLRKFDLQGFKSFEICGAEDSPTCVNTYAQLDPGIFDTPLETFRQDVDGNLFKVNAPVHLRLYK